MSESFDGPLLGSTVRSFRVYMRSVRLFCDGYFGLETSDGYDVETSGTLVITSNCVGSSGDSGVGSGVGFGVLSY